MNFYHKHVAPRVVAWSCSTRLAEPLRERVVSQARGRVLEVGAGAGANLAHYRPGQIEHLWALEPDPLMRRLATARIASAPVVPVWLQAPAEAVPLDDDTVDTVVVTYTLCTVPALDAALHELRRVLRPGGQLLFCEHGASPDPRVRRWQDRLDGVSRCLAGGCRLNRRPDVAIQEAGFTLTHLDTHYLAGAPRIGGFTYLGSARVP